VALYVPLFVYEPGIYTSFHTYSTGLRLLLEHIEVTGTICKTKHGQTLNALQAVTGIAAPIEPTQQTEEKEQDEKVTSHRDEETRTPVPAPIYLSPVKAYARLAAYKLTI
jgi:hypothetical protein